MSGVAAEADNPGVGLEGDLAAIATKLRGGAISSLQLAEECLERADKLQVTVHAFAWLDHARVRRDARHADRARASGAKLGPLHGVPVAIKDLFDTKGVPTEWGSRMFRNRVPVSDAAVVGLLKRSGAVIFGKTITTELAYMDPGPTSNPWNPRRTPGGSSMGSAAAVAAGIVPASLGSQTSGSIIRPAAFCGIVGFKPTAGRLPRRGMFLLSATLDQVGVFAASVPSVALMVAALVNEPLDAWMPSVQAHNSWNPRLGVYRGPSWATASTEMRNSFDKLLELFRTAGARVEEVPSFPTSGSQAARVHRTIVALESHRTVTELARERLHLAGPQLSSLLAAGATIETSVYEDALRQRDTLIREVGAWLAGYDAVVTLATTGEAPTTRTTGDPRFCILWTLVGAPAIAVPMGLSASVLPLGVQLVGGLGRDRLLLQTARWVEEELGGPVPIPPSIPM